MSVARIDITQSSSLNSVFLLLVKICELMFVILKNKKHFEESLAEHLESVLSVIKGKCLLISYTQKSDTKGLWP